MWSVSIFFTALNHRAICCWGYDFKDTKLVPSYLHFQFAQPFTWNCLPFIIKISDQISIISDKFYSYSPFFFILAATISAVFIYVFI